MRRKGFSKVRETVAAWNQVQQLLRSGDKGSLIPVVIPKDKRGFASLFWLALALYALLSAVISLISGPALLSPLGFLGFFVFAFLAVLTLMRSLIVEVEQGTTGILSSWGKIVGTISPGRRYIWKPWEKVEFIVDTSTEIPYTAPVLSSPTRENVPLKSIEFFLKFRIVDPVRFVRNIGASNFDIVLSSAVQDAIRRRSRSVETAKAYNLRGSDVGDMQEYLNRQMERYGVRITGANIPDVQLPEQYQMNLATQERVAKEQDAYEKEWDLTRKRRKDALELEIEKAKKERDAKLIAVREAVNKARQDVALMLQEKEADAEKIKLEIEAQGKAQLKAAENQAKALDALGKAYQDNLAVLRYELEIQRLQVAENLMRAAPRPLLVNAGEQGGQSSALSTLVLAHVLPDLMEESRKRQNGAPHLEAKGESMSDDIGGMVNAAVDEARKRIRGSKKG